MSSGRDEMMDHWVQEQKTQSVPKKTHYQRMREYRDTLVAELERLNKHIEELENETTTRSL